MVSDEDVPHVSSLYAYRNVARFTEDLELLARGRKALSLDEFLCATRDGGEPPENSFLLTFDDGFREMHDIVAPILTAKGIPAVFFVMSDMLDNEALCFQQKISLLLCSNASSAAKTATHKLLGDAGISGRDWSSRTRAVKWSQKAILDEAGHLLDVDFNACLREIKPYLTSTQISSMLQRGFSLGSHSIDHPRYGDIPLDEQISQTKESMTVLAHRFALSTRVFAFPHTDLGVTKKFFATLAEQRIVEATFGTAAPALDCVQASYQRFSMEKPDLNGKTLLARCALRRNRSRTIGPRWIQRN